jgi:hypothetical protein
VLLAGGCGGRGLGLAVRRPALASARLRRASQRARPRRVSLLGGRAAPQTWWLLGRGWGRRPLLDLAQGEWRLAASALALAIELD